MPYQVVRNGQTYGPYTLEDLQRYVASGNVLLTDLAKSEDMPDWVPVSQILSIPAVAAPLYAQLPSYPTPAIPYPDPPNLHWALVLVIGLFTCGIFSIVWELIQTRWVKKVEPASKALLYYIIFIGLEVLSIGGSLGHMAILLHGRRTGVTPASMGFTLLSGLVSVAIFVVVIVYRFTMRADIERHFNGPEPVGLRLSGVMTFFFGGLYFQYHFSRINEIKQSMRYRGAAV